MGCLTDEQSLGNVIPCGVFGYCRTLFGNVCKPFVGYKVEGRGGDMGASRNIELIGVGGIWGNRGFGGVRLLGGLEYS